jgi:hypothetical protein
MTRAPTYCRDSKLPSQEIQGRTVIVVPARSEMHQLDEVGTFVWGELKTKRSAQELARALCGEFDVDPDQAEKDVDAFLRLLGEKGLLTRE